MKSLRGFLIVGAITLAAIMSAVTGFVVDREIVSIMRSQYVDMLLRETLLARMSLVQGGLQRGELQGTLTRLGARLTLIDSIGTVVYDSDVDSARLHAVENHLGRPEVQEALHNGTGSYTRLSVTTGIEQLYAARYEPFVATINGMAVHVSFVRMSVALSDANAHIAAARLRVLVVILVILLLVAIAAAYVARRILRPIITMSHTARAIGQGDLSLRVSVESSDEIGELGRAVNAMVQKLEADIRELERLGRYRSEFLGDVSHELRTPIFAIQGSIETVLGDDAMPPEVRRSFLDTAMRNTTRLNSLVSDLIDISRIESGELRLSWRYFDIIPLAHDVLQEFRAAAERKGLNLSLDAPEMELSVYGDRERIRQVLLNLVDNAVKNTERGSVTIRITTADGRTTIAVSDTGIGIAPEHLVRIFERFYRVDKVRSRASGGTGLGLAIVKHIVEAHGGKIQVESTPDAGSTFWFELSA